MRIKLLEDSKKDQSNDQPYGNFGKPLIVQAKLQVKRGRELPNPHADHFRPFKAKNSHFCV